MEDKKKKTLSGILISVIPIILSTSALIISWKSYNVSREASAFEHNPNLTFTSFGNDLHCELAEENENTDYDKISCSILENIFNTGGVKARIYSIEASFSTNDSNKATGMNVIPYKGDRGGFKFSFSGFEISSTYDLPANLTIEPQDYEIIRVYWELSPESDEIILGFTRDNFLEEYPNADTLYVELWITFVNNERLYLGKYIITHFATP